jgi:hypothetical protein
MTLRGHRDTIRSEDRATLGSDPCALRGTRQPDAPGFSRLTEARRTPSSGTVPESAFSCIFTPGGGQFFVPRWNRPACLSPEAKTPVPEGAEHGLFR